MRPLLASRSQARDRLPRGLTALSTVLLACNSSPAEPHALGFDASVRDGPQLQATTQPVLLTSADEGISLAVDGSNVYWQGPGGSIFDCPLGGCPGGQPTQLTSLVGATTLLQSLVTAGGDVIFVSEAGVTSLDPRAPSPATTLYPSAQGTVSALATDGAELYLVASAGTDGGESTATVVACPIHGACSSPRTLYTSTFGLGPLAVAGSDVYFVEYGDSAEIRAVPSGGGSPRTLCQHPNEGPAYALVVAGGYAYVTGVAGPTSIVRCAIAGAGGWGTFTHDDAPYGLATDGANLYWTNYVPTTGSVAGCALGPSCPASTLVATGQASPFAIALSPASVFWTTSTSVYRVDR